MLPGLRPGVRTASGTATSVLSRNRTSATRCMVSRWNDSVPIIFFFGLLREARSDRATRLLRLFVDFVSNWNSLFRGVLSHLFSLRAQLKRSHHRHLRNETGHIGRSCATTEVTHRRHAVMSIAHFSRVASRVGSSCPKTTRSSADPIRDD